MPLGEPRQAAKSTMHQPDIGRESDSLRLHTRIDDDLGKIRRLRRAGPRRGRKALLRKGGELFFTHPLAPAGHRGAVEGQFVLEERIPAPKAVLREASFV